MAYKYGEKEREGEGSEPYADATSVCQAIWGRIGPTWTNWATAVKDDDSLQRMHHVDGEHDDKTWKPAVHFLVRAHMGMYQPNV